MNRMEQSQFNQEEQVNRELETEQEKRARLISRYIETKIIGANESINDEEEEEIKKYYEKISTREKTDILYSKIMAYAIDKQTESARKEEVEEKGEEFEPTEPDPYLISEIKVLFNDPVTQELFSATYGEARVDAKRVRISEFGNLWQDIEKEIKRKEETYKELERNIHLNKINGEGRISSAKSHMERLAENLSILTKRKEEMGNLEGFPKIAENTDVAAQFQYEQLKEYNDQLKKGFVWLPSRKKIHQETVSAILNHRWPVLIGEAGSGKSDQADAAAMELTGYPPTEVECESATGEKQLVMDKDIDPETGGGYDKYGPLMQAFTGYEDSRQKESGFKNGRIARFDESGRLGAKAFSIIKKARQKKSGEDFYGRAVLPGASAIWTTNPVGPRYPDRHTPDPAMRRELAEINVDYPDMSAEKPELYEFALTTLLDSNNHIAVAKKEISPAYEKKEIPEDKREILGDGSIVIAKDELVSDMSDTRHGALWRFCGAIKVLQDSFVYGNAETEKYPDSLLRFKEDADGNIETTSDGSGEPLTLSTSTVTLGELASWVSGFNERRQKQNIEFHTDTLTEWLNFKVNTYLKQADKADKEKIRAIFKHFHFLENAIPDIERAKPLTPKEIGYLSPRVPRPVYLEKPKNIGVPLAEKETLKEIKEYETVQVLLENGKVVLMRKDRFLIENGQWDMEAKTLAPMMIAPGKKFRFKNDDFSFAGVVEDKNSEYDGKSVGQLASGEKLYQIFSAEELDLGILLSYKKEIAENTDVMEKDIEEECAFEEQEK